MKNKKYRIIILSLTLVILISIGIFFSLNNKNINNIDNVENSDNKINDEIKDISKEDNEKKEVDKFYYTEEFISEKSQIGGGYKDIFIINGEFSIYNEGYLQHIKTKENIIKIPKNLDEDFTIYDKEFYNIMYDKDFKKVTVDIVNSEGEKKESIVLNDYKGLVVDDSYILIKKIKVTENYIYLLTQSSFLDILQIFTKTGELKKSYYNVVSFDVDGNENICISAVETLKSKNPYGLFVVNSESGEEVFKNSYMKLDNICFSYDGQQIYGLDLKNGEINTYSAKHGDFNKLILTFGIDSTYLLDDYNVKNMILGKNDEIAIWLTTKLKDNQDFREIRHLHYLYEKQVGERPVRQTTLVVTEPYRSDFMQEAIKLYELKYPSEHIEYNYAYNSSDAYYSNLEEHTTKFNLDIIQGSIGDIVRLESLIDTPVTLDYQNLFRTDVFMDLDDLINKDDKYKYLNKEVLNAVRINDSIRGIPINYNFTQWELNEDLEKQLGLDLDFNNISWSEILDLVKLIEEKAPDKHLFTVHSERSAWEQFGFGKDLLMANMPDLINLDTKKIDLNQQWFKDLLIKFKECSKSQNFMLKNTELDLLNNLDGSLLAKGANYGGYYNDNVGRYGIYNESNNSRYIHMFAGEKNNNRVAFTKLMYSINNRSERKEAAWKFLSFLLEEDIQFIATRTKLGIPISEKGVDKMIEAAIQNRAFPEEQYKEIREKYNKSMKDSSHKIDYLYDMGNMKNDLFDAINLYMKDEISLDEALKKAEEKILIRLNE